jgi:hypothetical protein
MRVKLRLSAHVEARWKFLYSKALPQSRFKENESGVYPMDKLLIHLKWEFQPVAGLGSG